MVALRRIKRVINRSTVRTWLRNAVLGADFEPRLQALETSVHESREETWERSRTWWRAAEPNPNLTWGIEVSGEAFVSKAAQYGALGPRSRVLEVGPGYGRLLAACLQRGASFGSYVGVDLSRENLSYLRERFPQENVAFLHGDVETFKIDEPVDAVISSLTFKHLFPSFEEALRNLGRQLRPGGLAVFDLLEGHRRYFAEDGVTYVRSYTQPEIKTILAATGFELVAFDQVHHLPDYTRLLVVARKPV
jgi:SAM-dependent methyltransferase